MTIGCHLLLSWQLARYVSPDYRTRRWIAWAGAVPDLDGAGLLVDAATGRTELYQAWHHILGHNFLAAMVLAVLAIGFCRNVKVGVWTWLSFHLHLAADLLSGRGPDGSAWPLVYGWPLDRQEWHWAGQWPLDYWPNVAIFLGLLTWTVFTSRKEGRSPMEMVSRRLDAKVVGAFRSMVAGRHTS